MSPTATQNEPTVSKTGKTIILAQHLGFCHGVKKAVDKTVDANASQDKPVYVLGQLIHNPQMIDKLSDQGIQTVESLNDVPAGSVCVIRTHGAPPELLAEAEAKGVGVTDATCPDVRMVQDKAISLAEEGYTVVIVGKKEHPEVIGITAHAQQQVPGAHIVAVHSVDELSEKMQGIPRRRIGVVSQTTQLEESFFDMVKALSKVAKELKVYNTICPATFFRQNAALDLAAQVDFMVVIGGKNSSNTTHLADICREQGTETVHIETYTELADNEMLKRASRVGVTAGASTPDFLISEVVDYIQTL